MKKKLSSLCLLFIMGLLLITAVGCGGPTGPVGPGPDGGNPDIEKPEKPDEMIHRVVIYGIKGDIIREIKVLDGECIDPKELEMPEIPGYIFNGFSEDLKSPIYNDMEVKAYYKEEEKVEKYTITIRGGNIWQSFEVESGREYKLPEQYKENYEFVGYTYNGEEFPMFGVYNYDFSIELNVVFKALDMQIEYNLAGGENSINNKTILKEGESLTLEPATKKGYKFIGWYDMYGAQVEVVQFEAGVNLRLEARFEKGISVIYHLDGGTNSPYNPDFVKEIWDLNLNNPTKKDYVFVGWYLDPEYKIKFDLKNYYGNEDVINLYARFVDKNAETIITLNFNDGVTKPLVIRAKYGEYVEIPYPQTRPGYTFRCFVKDGSDEKDHDRYLNSGQMRINTAGEVSYTADWSPNRISISYSYGNGYCDYYNPEDMIVGTAPIIQEPTIEHGKFVGWYFDSEFTQPATDLTKVFESFTLYAKYEMDMVKLSFDLMGGTTDMELPTEWEYGKSITLPTLTKEGYEFRGYNIEGDDPSNTYYTYAPKADTKFIANFDAEYYGYEVEIDGDRISYMIQYGTPISFEQFNRDYLTIDHLEYNKQIINENDPYLFPDGAVLQAITSPKEFKITYHIYDGVNSKDNPETYNYLDSDIIFHEPTRVGYYFKYWSFFESGETRNDKLIVSRNNISDVDVYGFFDPMSYSVTIKINNLDIVLQTNIEYMSEFKLTNIQGYDLYNVTLNGEPFNKTIYDLPYKITLNADCKPTTYKITYHTNGGINDKRNKASVIRGEEFMVYDAYKEGYKFEGWYYDEELTNKFYNRVDQSMYGDINLYAKYVAAEYIIRVYPNIGGAFNVAIKPNESISEKLQLNVLELEDYTYNGEALASDLFEFNHDIELEATYKYKAFNIKYELNGGVNSKNNPITYTAIDEFILEPATKDGISFLGWYDEYDNEVTTINYGWNSKDLVLYAKYSQAITVSYQIPLDGGYVNPNPTKILVGTVLKDLDCDVNDFLGWKVDGNWINYISEDLNGKVITAEIKIITYDVEVYFYNTSTLVTYQFAYGKKIDVPEPVEHAGKGERFVSFGDYKIGDVFYGSNRRLYAVYENIVYHVDFDVPVKSNLQEFTYTYNYNINLPAAEDKEYYDFIGWSHNGVIINKTDDYAEDMHLIATYKERIHTVTIDYGFGEPKVIKVSEAEVYKLPPLKRDGYKDGEYLLYGQVATELNHIVENVKIEVRWEEPITISFTGTETHVPAIKAPRGGLIELPVVDNPNFVGWMLDGNILPQVLKNNYYNDFTLTAVFKDRTTEFTYSIEYGTSIILNTYKGTSSFVTIPSMIEGKPVRKLNSLLFNNDFVRVVTVPSSVNDIYFEAFSYCTNLYEVIILGDVHPTREIIRECNNLRKLTIPYNTMLRDFIGFIDASNLDVTIHNINSIVPTEQVNPFYGIEALNSITIGDGIKLLDGYLLIDNFNDLYLTSDSLETIDLNLIYRLKRIYYNSQEQLFRLKFNSAIGEGYDLYINNQYIEDFVLEDSITKLPGHALFGANIRFAELNNYVDIIPAFLFGKNTCLRTIVLGSSTTKIEAHALPVEITYLYYRGTRDSWKLIQKVDSEVPAYGRVEFLTEELEEVTNSKYSYKVVGNKYIVDLRVLDKDTRVIDLWNEFGDLLVVSFADDGLLGLSKLEYMLIGHSLVAIDFMGCNPDVKLYFKGNTTMWSTMSDKPLVEALTEVRSIEYINDGAKEYILFDKKSVEIIKYHETCSEVVDFNADFPNYTVTKIAERAFNSNDTIRNVVLKDITEIPNRAFAYARNLETIELNPEITAIGEKAFLRCISLKSVSIPTKVRNVGVDAFRGCTSLKTVEFNENSMDTLDDFAFADCPMLTSIKLPDMIDIKIGKSLIAGSQVTNIVLPVVFGVIDSSFIDAPITDAYIQPGARLTNAFSSEAINYHISSINNFMASTIDSLKGVKLMIDGKLVDTIEVGDSKTDKTLSKIFANNFTDYKYLKTLNIQGPTKFVANAFKTFDSSLRVNIANDEAWLKSTFENEASSPAYATRIYLNDKEYTNPNGSSLPNHKFTQYSLSHLNITGLTGFNNASIGYHTFYNSHIERFKMSWLGTDHFVSSGAFEGVTIENLYLDINNPDLSYPINELEFENATIHNMYLEETTYFDPQGFKGAKIFTLYIGERFNGNLPKVEPYIVLAHPLNPLYQTMIDGVESNFVVKKAKPEQAIMAGKIIRASATIKDYALIRSDVIIYNASVLESRLYHSFDRFIPMDVSRYGTLSISRNDFVTYIQCGHDIYVLEINDKSIEKLDFRTIEVNANRVIAIEPNALKDLPNLKTVIFPEKLIKADFDEMVAVDEVVFTNTTPLLKYNVLVAKDADVRITSIDQILKIGEYVRGESYNVYTPEGKVMEYVLPADVSASVVAKMNIHTLMGGSGLEFIALPNNKLIIYNGKEINSSYIHIDEANTKLIFNPENANIANAENEFATYSYIGNNVFNIKLKPGRTAVSLSGLFAGKTIYLDEFLFENSPEIKAIYLDDEIKPDNYAVSPFTSDINVFYGGVMGYKYSKNQTDVSGATPTYVKNNEYEYIMYGDRVLYLALLSSKTLFVDLADIIGAKNIDVINVADTYEANLMVVPKNINRDISQKAIVDYVLGYNDLSGLYFYNDYYKINNQKLGAIGEISYLESDNTRYLTDIGSTKRLDKTTLLDKFTYFAVDGIFDNKELDYIDFTSLYLRPQTNNIAVVEAKVREEYAFIDLAKLKVLHAVYSSDEDIFTGYEFRGLEELYSYRTDVSNVNAPNLIYLHGDIQDVIGLFEKPNAIKGLALGEDNYTIKFDGKYYTDSLEVIRFTSHYYDPLSIINGLNPVNLKVIDLIDDDSMTYLGFNLEYIVLDRESKNVLNTFYTNVLPAMFVKTIEHTQNDRYRYSIINGKYIVIDEFLDKAAAAVDITSDFAGMEVVTIGSKAFRDMTNIKSVIIPESVRIIGREAFMNTGLSAIDLPDSLELVLEDAFRNTNIATIDEAFTNPVVFEGAFNDMPTLESINISTPIDVNRSFNNCVNLTSVILPKSYNTIDSFENSYIQYLDIQRYYIDDYAILSHVKEAVFRNEIHGFRYMGQLEKVSFIDCPEVREISFCSNLKEIYITGPNIESITLSEGFNQLPNLTKVVMDDKVNSIKSYAFNRLPNLKEIVLSKNLKSIPDSFAQDCGNLTTINLPDGLLEIGSDAFSGCNSLELVIPSTVTKLGRNYYSNENKKIIYIPENIELAGYATSTIGYSIYIPASVKITGSISFNGTVLFEANEAPAGVEITSKMVLYGVKKDSIKYVDNENYSYLLVDSSVYDLRINNRNATVIDLTNDFINLDVISINTNSFATLEHIEKLYLPETVKSLIGPDELNNIASVYITNLDKFMAIDNNSFMFNTNIYVNNELLTEIRIDKREIVYKADDIMVDTIIAAGELEDVYFRFNRFDGNLIIEEGIKSIGLEGDTRLKTIIFADSITSGRVNITCTGFVRLGRQFNSLSYLSLSSVDNLSIFIPKGFSFDSVYGQVSNYATMLFEDSYDNVKEMIAKREIKNFACDVAISNPKLIENDYYKYILDDKNIYSFTIKNPTADVMDLNTLFAGYNIINMSSCNNEYYSYELIVHKSTKYFGYNSLSCVKNLVLDKDVFYISSSAIDRYGSLIKTNIDPLNPKYSDLGGNGIYNKLEKKLVKVLKEGLIPSDCEVIEEYAINLNIRNEFIPISVTRIENQGGLENIYYEGTADQFNAITKGYVEFGNIKYNQTIDDFNNAIKNN